jgi:hypothetical protein
MQRNAVFNTLSFDELFAVCQRLGNQLINQYAGWGYIQTQGCGGGTLETISVEEDGSLIRFTFRNDPLYRSRYKYKTIEVRRSDFSGSVDSRLWIRMLFVETGTDLAIRMPDGFLYGIDLPFEVQRQICMMFPE